MMSTVGNNNNERDGDPFATIYDKATSRGHHLPGQPSTGPIPPPAARYVPLRPHAKGGLGEVFVALDEELGREVALKAIQDRHADDPASQARFVREAEITGNLEHPGIVPVYGLGRWIDGRPYYAMRFIEGETLDAALARYHGEIGTDRGARHRSKGLVQLLGRFISVCNAIHYAHSRGILHRDLKPSNIMLGTHGETLVVDWGLARTIKGTAGDEPSAAATFAAIAPTHGSEQTLPGSAVGTPAFMSPEQAAGSGEALGPASDIYNLGATLYCILTGKPPFENAPPAELLAKALKGDFPPPRAVAKQPVSPPLEAVCLKAMALRPEDRYPTAKALADDIICWIADEPVTAYRESPFERISRWSRRHRTWVNAGAAVVAGLLLVLSMAVGVVNRAWHREQYVRSEAERLAASLDLDQGLSLCEQGWAGRGMLRMAHALSILPGEAKDLRQTVLDNIAGWSGPLIPLREQIPHRGPVHALAFRADGKALLTGGGPEARLWDPATGQPLGPPLLHEGLVRSVAIHPSGASFLTGANDGKARLWDARTGALIGSPPAHDEPVVAVAFAPDGLTFLTVSGRSVSFWETATLRPLPPLPAHESPVNTAAFTPDGKTIATGAEDGAVRFWDLDARKLIGSPLQHLSEVRCLALSPDGKTIGVGTALGIIRFWEVATHRRLLSRPSHDADVVSITFSPDGKTVITGSEDNTARLWDFGTGLAVGTPMESLGTVFAVAFRPDGHGLATGSDDSLTRLWGEPQARPLRARIDTGGDVIGVAYDPLGKTFVTAGRHGAARVWDSATLKPIGEPLLHRGEVRSVVFHPGGAAFATGCSFGSARIWDAATLKMIGKPLRMKGPANTLAFGPATHTLLAADQAGTVRLWDADAGRFVGPELKHGSPVTAIASGPDGRTIVTADGSTARVWEVRDGKVTGRLLWTLRGHQGPILCAAYSRDGRWVGTGSVDNTARIWDVATGQAVGMPFEHRSSVNTLAIGPRRRFLLTGSSDQTARLWSIATSRPIGPPLVHFGRVSAVAFHPDGKTFLTGSFDRSARVWNAPRRLEDDFPRIRNWIEVLTGMTLDTHSNVAGLIKLLREQEWHRHRAQLEQRGGSPLL